MQKVKQHILTHGSVVTAVCIFPDFKEYYVTNTTAVYDIPSATAFQYVGSNQVLGHAIACTGWDDANMFWICRNSWGPGWADGGYFRVSPLEKRALISILSCCAQRLGCASWVRTPQLSLVMNVS